MKEGKLQIYCGNGKGKTTAAIGQAIREASKGCSVFIVQFLKGKQEEEISFIKRLEPEIKLFRFQKREEAFENLTEQEKEEEIPNLKNGLNFARKVLATGECDVLILDEVLGAPGTGNCHTGRTPFTAGSSGKYRSDIYRDPTVSGDAGMGG